ncbi:hypothetical protein LZ480_18245 [Solibacillus sp. MA9]|uniref:YfhD family protein n=1 Tax=Solibacillus palustris TaxID=2908203 RepID=A0ABS9UI82_9BACL|nr:hypothetical protein [Solibacillus sp. MA9]MCH7323814.1 hypothetical protein [Solibacillus sp. MA9]
MSNMNENRNHATAKGKQSMEKREVNRNPKKFQLEEFGTEFDFDTGSKQAKANNNQPVSERSAWH